MLNEEVLVLRRKILGVLIRNARIKAGMSQKELAGALEISSGLLTDIEFGRRDVSLPQLEAMAYLFHIPLSYFWSDGPIDPPEPEISLKDGMALRRRIIGVLLKQARTQAGHSQKEVAEFLGCTPGRVSSYEFGKNDIPAFELEQLADFLDVSLDYFVDKGLVPQSQQNGRLARQDLEHLADLSDDVREFVLNPANELYLRVAMRLGQLSTETLRALAEGILDITY
ncbi:MAG: helix-turn-helix domain-containing protein [Anaerolineae bacterium]